MGAPVFDKAKKDCSWGDGGRGVQRDALVGAKPPIFYSFCIKHTKTVIGG